MPFGNRKNILKDLFSSVLSQFKKYHAPENMKFNYLCIFQSLKLSILIEKIISISLEPNITSVGCNGLNYHSTYLGDRGH